MPARLVRRDASGTLALPLVNALLRSVSGHLSRTFGIWTITSAAIRYAAAYHITDPVYALRLDRIQS